ncbi:MAG: hypothetical protein M1819_004676 [Sarea resinae]|nr:MAG: hypothetical protein M1819_004676 [Sarea resinae]
MSRPSNAMTRNNLSLTEELEKLEQSITLTLQEIDHNFSRAHRIVTTSILPVVEQYAEHSKAVWEGSKFWKQFFEASANVSLSGYEEATGEDTTMQEDTTQDEHENIYASSPSRGANDTAVTADESGPQASRYNEGPEDDSLLDSLSLSDSHSTPRAPRPTSKGRSPATGATFADYPSPYETLKNEIHGNSSQEEGSSSELPSTPGRQKLPDVSMTPSPSPYGTANSYLPSTQRRGVNTDPLLHTVLDKNYRVRTTPHAQARLPRPNAQVHANASTTTPQSKGRWQADDSSPLSSPEIAAPELHAEIFSSPVRGVTSHTPMAPRTPGVSVQTPRGKGNTIGKGRTTTLNSAMERSNGGGGSLGGVWDSDSDDDDSNLAFSPPKTMQFHVPQSRLLQTPAREASKRIVEDLLLTAGGNVTDDLEEDSPSVIRRNEALDDESF